ncbi:MAG: hypothetical protein J2P15_20295, partial [Micromonosporaceae bacterium]|nr:hypothetical protein [Micromonosporaceae bacterium]
MSAELAVAEPIGDDAGPGTEAQQTRHGRWSWRRIPRADAVAVVLYFVGTIWVMWHLLPHPGRVGQLYNLEDHAFFQFALAHSARVVSHGVNPFFTAQINAPDGVNMMANTSIFGLAIPLAPVTLLFGPAVSYAVLMVLAMFFTAFSWYYMLSRHLLGRGA